MRCGNLFDHTRDGGVIYARTDDVGALGLVKFAPVAESVPFMRGHTNTDGALEVADAVCFLTYLFGPPTDPCKESVAQCLDAADANDDGRLNISDAVMILRHVFMGNELPPPFETCGPDVSADELGCFSFEACE